MYYYNSKEELAKILVGEGIDVNVGIWALRIPGFARSFKIAYVGNITPDAPFEVDGDRAIPEIDFTPLNSNLPTS